MCNTCHLKHQGCVIPAATKYFAASENNRWIEFLIVPRVLSGYNLSLACQPNYAGKENTTFYALLKQSFEVIWTLEWFKATFKTLRGELIFVKNEAHKPVKL